MSGERGVEIAQYNCALCLDDGRGTRHNMSKAAHYYTLSTDPGIMNVQFNYTVCLVHGDGVRPNAAAAITYHKISAYQGHTQAQLCYCDFLANSEENRDSTLMAHCYKLTVHQDPVKGQYSYRLCLTQGDGVNRNTEAATGYLKLAADQRHLEAETEYAALISNHSNIKGRCLNILISTIKTRLKLHYHF